MATIVAMSAVAGSANAFLGYAPMRNGTEIHVVLATDRSSYHVGQTIKLRVGLKNVGAEAVAFIIASPWHAANLTVTDGSGKRILRDHEVDPADNQTTHGTAIQPGKTFILAWMGANWSDISRWGYHLTKPGTYIIRGSPLVTGNFTVDFTTVRSNAVKVTIH